MKADPEDLDIAVDFLEASLASNKRSLVAFLSSTDHLEIVDYLDNLSKYHVKVEGVQTAEEPGLGRTFVRLVPYSNHVAVAKGGLTDIIIHSYVKA